METRERVEDSRQVPWCNRWYGELLRCVRVNRRGRLWSSDPMDDIGGVLTMVLLYVDRGWASRSPLQGRRVIIRAKLNDDTTTTYLKEAKWSRGDMCLFLARDTGF